MTDDEQAEAEAWADVGRRINALADELTALGWVVEVQWRRPLGTVRVTIRDRP